MANALKVVFAHARVKVRILSPNCQDNCVTKLQATAAIDRAKLHD